MTSEKVTELTATTAPALTDILYIVTDPGGTPISKKVTNQSEADLFLSNSVLAIATASATVANSSSEATVIGTVSGSLTLAAAYLTAGRSLHIRAMGFVSTTGTPNLTLKFKLGSTVIASTGAVATGSGLANALWTVDVWLTCRTTGATGTVFAQGQAFVAAAYEPMVNTTTSTIDTTGTLAMQVTAQFSAADPANTITGTNVYIQKVN
jgi:hypothetical protein